MNSNKLAKKIEKFFNKENRYMSGKERSTIMAAYNVLVNHEDVAPTVGFWRRCGIGIRPMSEGEPPTTRIKSDIPKKQDNGDHIIISADIKDLPINTAYRVMLRTARRTDACIAATMGTVEVDIWPGETLSDIEKKARQNGWPVPDWNEE